ncbi:MAG: glucosyl-3-phosphoglycerate synthase [Actinomycetota bacterium]
MQAQDAWEWFGKHTFHHADYDAATLAADKLRRTTTISVVLPALNEERTIGPIIRTLRRELMDRIPLIDELVVIDPGSIDATAKIAAEAGARVVSEADLLPELGRVAGKGEALWKSLYATTGDIVCWLDADIEDFRCEFVTGLVGPLLTDPALAYVKGFYERPLSVSRGLQMTGGGRVTELVARPLLNTYWPALAGFVQPLSGEYAGRRAVLEQVPFVSGYGVELGLLIDLLDLVGLDAMAQVDLERRVHAHQDHAALGRMAFTLQQTALTRLQRSGRLVLSEPAEQTMMQFAMEDGIYAVTHFTADLSERPPMASIRATREVRDGR